MEDIRVSLLRYLDRGRDAIVWKLDGLGEYDARRPMTPTGTNLLGLVKHLACCEAEYFGRVFGRPFPEPIRWWQDGAEPNGDMWATADETREQILEFYAAARRHADDTIAALPLDAVGRVPWWPSDRRETTLHRVVVHMIDETSRHAGHADILRETIDASAGLASSNFNLAEGDEAWWRSYHDRVEAAAREAAGGEAERGGHGEAGEHGESGRP